MKKYIRMIAVFLLIMMCVNPAFAEDVRTYTDPVNQEKYVLSFEQNTYKQYIGDERVDMGVFSVDEEKQQLKLVSANSMEGTVLRFVGDTIYGGDVWNWYSYASVVRFGESYGITGLENMSAEGAQSEKNALRIAGPRIALIDGALYDSLPLFNDESMKRGDEETYSEWVERIAEDGRKYIAGWYSEELIKKGFLLCMFTDEYLHGETCGEAKDMLWGAWTDKYGYSQVFLNERSENYRTAVKVYEKVRSENRLTPVLAPEETPIPVDADWKRKLQTAWDASGLYGSAADYTIRHIRYDNLDRFMDEKHEAEWRAFTWLPEAGDIFMFDGDARLFVMMDENQNVTKTYWYTDEDVTYKETSLQELRRVKDELNLKIFFSALYIDQYALGGYVEYAQDVNKWHSYTREQLLLIW